MSINIAGLTPVEDPSYRYKMPKLIGKVEGRGNGIKTVIVNCVDIGNSLNRDPSEVCKFFGTELGSQTSYAADRAIVNGAHADADLQKHLCRYIEHFVLCKNCHLPETHYKIKEGLISQKCLACGSKESVDMTHKLCTYILAQHKKAKETAKAAEKASGKKDKKVKKEKKEGEDHNGNGHSNSNGDVTNSNESSPPSHKKDKESKEHKKDKEGKESKKKGGMTISKSNSDVALNVFGISGRDKDHDSSADDEESDSKAADEAMERLKLWLSDNANASTQQLMDELRNIQTMASLRPSDRVIIYLGAIFTENAVTDKEIEKHHAVLAALAATNIQQRHLIAAFEWFCGTHYPSLVRFFPVFLKQLLDEELVEEDTFYAWAGDFARNEFSAEQSMICLDTLEQLKNSAAPFIKWLQEAEEEGDDDEEDDDDDDDEENGEEGSEEDH